MLHVPDIAFGTACAFQTARYLEENLREIGLGWFEAFGRVKKTEVFRCIASSERRLKQCHEEEATEGEKAFHNAKRAVWNSAQVVWNSRQPQVK